MSREDEVENLFEFFHDLNMRELEDEDDSPVHGRVVDDDNEPIVLPEPGLVTVRMADGEEETRPMTEAEIAAWHKAEGVR